MTKLILLISASLGVGACGSIPVKQASSTSAVDTNDVRRVAAATGCNAATEYHKYLLRQVAAEQIKGDVRPELRLSASDLAFAFSPCGK